MRLQPPPLAQRREIFERSDAWELVTTQDLEIAHGVVLHLVPLGDVDHGAHAATKGRR